MYFPATATTSETMNGKWAIVGTPVQDHFPVVDNVSFAQDQVQLSSGEESFTISYRGQLLKWGDKVTASVGLGEICSRIKCKEIVNGGGVRNTSAYLAELCERRNLPIRIVAVDNTVPWPELEAEYDSLGVQHVTLEMEQSRINMILTNGTADRVILKSPQESLELDEEQRRDFRRLIPEDLEVMMINSPGSPEVAELASDAAQSANAPQFVVLTTKLRLDLRKKFLARSQVGVCNLTEFSTIAGALGLPCPTDELSASLPSLARVMDVASRRCRVQGDLVVTLGARGCLVRERNTGEVYHVALRHHHCAETQIVLAAHPERKNGAGDRFFAAFVLAHVLNEGTGRAHAVCAALEASLDAVRYLVPELNPCRDWMELHLLSKPLIRLNTNGGI